MSEDDRIPSKINKLVQRIDGLEDNYRDLGNEKPIDVSTELKKIRQTVIQSRFREATRLSEQLQTILQQRRERDNEIIQTIEDQIITDLLYFEST
jgi:hypothetical protein